jgi:hypothetical protein
MTDQPNRYLTTVLYPRVARRALAERSNVAYVATLKVHQLLPARSATNLRNTSVRATGIRISSLQPEHSIWDRLK